MPACIIMMALRFKLSRVVFRRLLVPRVLFECCVLFRLLFVFVVCLSAGGGRRRSSKWQNPNVLLLIVNVI